MQAKALYTQHLQHFKINYQHSPKFHKNTNFAPGKRVYAKSVSGVRIPSFPQ